MTLQAKHNNNVLTTSNEKQYHAKYITAIYTFKEDSNKLLLKINGLRY